MTFLQIVPDLHIYIDCNIIPKASQLALLGKIGHVKDPGLCDFPNAQPVQFRVVFHVPGNHETLRVKLGTTRCRLNDFQREIVDVSQAPNSANMLCCIRGNITSRIATSPRWDALSSPKCIRPPAATASKTLDRLMVGRWESIPKNTTCNRSD
ncbi:hypothetical protein CCHL11_09385 [Colletotrichum chlorophyti]|uniref:Uncharacterized protein n=1 Tax=Colletotrichum chlorophyti TaxID=708187 RepID=A0A1Q8R9M7_9PEZI|nr:hypothetical protein CCHL11_09385 [Colletotrichum chlorophyti]